MTHRKLGVIRALVASIAATGLGYLYVGRAKLAVLLVFGLIGSIVVISWSRVILKPWGFYLLAIILISLTLTSVIHSAMIAFREPAALSKFYNRWWVYLVWLLVILFGFNLLTMYRAYLFGYETFRVPAVSMAPTLQPGDFLLSDTWRYRREKPVAGELVVVAPELHGPKYIKRMIATPGDTIELRNGVVIVNGEAIVEPYLHAPRPKQPYGRDIAPITLAKRQYYVLGDFRDNSLDSRAFGPVTISEFHGRSEFVWLSYADGRIQWDRFPRWLIDQQVN